MGKILHARLDDATTEILRELVVKLESTESQVVREALKHLAAVLPKDRKRKIIGIGEFDSGIRDLGSNKKHLSGFGK